MRRQGQGVLAKSRSSPDCRHRDDPGNNALEDVVRGLADLADRLRHESDAARSGGATALQSARVRARVMGSYWEGWD